MKKKLLSLLMAGAVVAGTTMPAYAQTYNVLETDTINAQVKVTGQVTDKNGGAPAGRLEVEVPTALSFTVNANGDLTAANFEIKNNSKVDIDVKVGSFKETNTTGGITLHNDASTLAGEDRSNVHIALRSDSNRVALTDGITDKDLQVIKGGDVAVIQVVGEAGKQSATSTHGTPNVDDNGVSETFDLVFKITKANTQPLP